MRSTTVIFIVAVTALVSYSLGRQDAPTNNKVTAAAPRPTFSTPVALASVTEQVPARAQDKLEPAGRADHKPSEVSSPAPPVRSDVKRNAEIALETATIAAILIKVSRDQYYATGHPCACPNDSMRNGRACGARSAYSKPGGAAPLCYPSDITDAMIKSYRQTANR
jgi:hypothetical protein